MSLIIYEAVRESECDRTLGERSEIIVWQHPPQLGDEVRMGSDRLWDVIHIEPYQCGDQCLHVAMVARPGVSIGRDEWRSSRRREFAPNVSFYIHVSHDRRVIYHGWNMQGDAPSGRLIHYLPTGHETLRRPESSPWTIERVETFLPTGEATYSSIHLCWCTSEDVSISA
jgi:hypothetical protein